MLGRITYEKKRLHRGSAILETAMLVPILFALFLAIIQIIIAFQSATMTQYAAFVAARAYQVYGERKLKEIAYPHVRQLPYTNSEQTIAEAAAEKVIFESLVWEHDKIEAKTSYSLDRVYRDGIDQDEATNSQGTVRVKFLRGATPQGVRVTYCMPIMFSLFDLFLENSHAKNVCRNTRSHNSRDGLPMSKDVFFGREPDIL